MKRWEYRKRQGGKDRKRKGGEISKGDCWENNKKQRSDKSRRGYFKWREKGEKFRRKRAGGNNKRNRREYRSNVCRS